MQAQFLLGPAGSGKTFRCLAEIRAELRRDPAGDPLLLLAPKQATAQLERQLLSDVPGEPPLLGYTRLQVISFDRLARLVLEDACAAAPGWLDDEGRVMILRALLAQKRDKLKLFHATARLPGFARSLSNLLHELQNHRLSPRQLQALAGKITQPRQLGDKLHDFALLLESYQGWLAKHGLLDADTSLDAAADTLRRGHKLKFAGLWLDGFAELTEQELTLLAAVVPFAGRNTLAFCLSGEIRDAPPWLSPWAIIGQTYLRCRQRIAELPGAKVEVKVLSKPGSPTRFSSNLVLAQLAAGWPYPVGDQPSKPPHPAPRTPQLHLAVCSTPEMEAVLAAREIRRFVREGGRYREAAVMVRSLTGYADTIHRVFTRYEVPFFLDRREPVAHHPLAELTRYALRTAAFNWRQSDWFGALKTGFVPAAEGEIDRMENLALEHGWEGDVWHVELSLPDQPALVESVEHLRQKIVPPFAAFSQQLAPSLSGAQLAEAIRELWRELGVPCTLERWSTCNSQLRGTNPKLHQTVFEQMKLWLDNLANAFPIEALPLREWLPILEAGLASLTVGVIPPTLDQVIVGAIDRSRSPDLKLALVLGVNEGVFPSPPREEPLLNEMERDALAIHGARFGAGTRRQLGHEWFYGYIACTRASERLVLTCAEQDARGNKLNRSPFFDHLKKIFPDIEVEAWRPPAPFAGPEHLQEIIAPALRLRAGGEGLQISTLAALDSVLAKSRQVKLATTQTKLTPETAARLHGSELATSVSALENFAACPFKFFISHGLRARERREFELDARERGTFQHEVLTIFHNELSAEKKHWRDITPNEAKKRVRRIGERLLPMHRGGLLTADTARKFSGQMLLAGLETVVGVLVGWARDYRFDPALVEVGFGLPDASWPAWRLDLGSGHDLALRGRIDRVDVCRDAATGAALVVVMDYKSGGKKPDPLKLYHGLQLQLPAYLLALEQLQEARVTLGVSSLQAAGVFYVNLRGEFASAKSRGEALADVEMALRMGYQHLGRYDATAQAQLDPADKGEQFKTSPQARDRMDAAAFRDLLTRTVENLQRFGRDIYSGVIAVEPFRKGSETACDWCEYAAICRFDPWTQEYRALKLPVKTEEEAS